MTGPCTLNAFSVLADNDRRKEEGGTEHHREEKRERLAVGERLEEGRRAGVRSTLYICAPHATLPQQHRLSPWECDILPHLMQGVHDLQGEAFMVLINRIEMKYVIRCIL